MTSNVSVSQWVGDAADAMYGPWTLAFFLGTGVFLSIRYRVPQLTRLPAAFRAAFASPDASRANGGALSPFQSFATALAASIGTGNIAGVATAIVAGGPGALFWIWAYGFVATTIKFTEATLGARFRRGGSDTLECGPMLYLEKGLNSRFLGVAYAITAGFAALLTTPLAQSNSIAVVFESEFGISPLHCGVGLCIGAAVVVLGGVRSVGRAAQALSPLKIVLYLGGGAVVLATFANRLPAAFASIFAGAFSMESVAGGTLGVVMMEAMRYGVARGIYANEAGYGSAAIAYGAAIGSEPARQGLAAIIEVYVVSFLTSSVSGLCVIVSGAVAAGRNSTSAVAYGFDAAMPGYGGAIVAIATLLFGYTTLVGWSFFGEQILMHLFGRRIAIPYRLLYCALMIVGATGEVTTIWAWGDLLNALQIFPNLIGVLGLSGLVARDLRLLDSRQEEAQDAERR